MDIQDSCGTLLKQIHDALEKQANNSLRADGLTMAQVGVLLMLDRAEHRQMPLKELEKALHVAQSTAAGIVSRLEQKGLVESFGDAEDRRVKVVRLSEAGAGCCRTADARMAEAERQLLSSLTEAERDIFILLLRKVRDSLQ
ncbi:MAG TPA: MarR family transcriptional regulator [Candidatus Intestinimonas stercorigallinarum]|nr:MarR family transcriptional regulator [Candidatus Intestinimonas stercorigallinarum]